MDENTDPLAGEHFSTLLTEGTEDAVAEDVERLKSAPTEDRREALQALRQLLQDRPREFAPILTALTEWLVDEERSIRLTTIKLFVAVAEADPAAVVQCIDEIADRLADEDEFYYVRARAAETLGYVALEHPDEVASPELLADLRIGLSFDGPEVKEKLAKALEYVALGNPDRLRHQVSSLGEHLDDQNELVRYHLCTALVVIGCEYPAKLGDASAELTARLTDENPYVRGRAAEGLGRLLRSVPDDVAVSANDLPSVHDEEDPFVADRLRFARNAFAEENQDNGAPDEIGTLDAIRGTTDEIVEELTSPDGGGECPQCGLLLPENSPPMCPRCGAPY
jgi:HEAT repeat protein